ncbi:outer membrane beta-barrel protein [Penaeicola halotolerans]|uniref:outer membrane beta-barrel protein n=1 Tax=Penaeicola halotolerans TaxID=2793196 RepID=UPI001CF878B2|nr:outer membrane beta-barrel protein [Penaeicola halotolerans]
MKKFLLILCIAFLGTFAAQAQVRLGGTIGYGTQIEALGIGVIGDYKITENIGVAANFAYYFAEDTEFSTTDFWELNGNINYYFVTNESIEFYGLGGLNYSRISTSFDGFGFSGSAAEGELGLNLGVGSNFNIGKNFLPFGEIKYIIGDFDQLVIQAGVKFNLN